MTSAHQARTIVCGVDFTEGSARALHAAAELALRSRATLHVVHAIDPALALGFPQEVGNPERWASASLQRLIEPIRARAIAVSAHVEHGTPDDVLEAAAARTGAALIVIGALGQRHPERASVGSHVERLAQRSHVPVLVVRATDLEAWSGKRPLRVFAGIDMSSTSEAAIAWIAKLSALGPCEVSAAHLYWPPEQYHRLGLTGVRAYHEPDEVVNGALHRDLSARLAHGLGSVPFTLAVEPHMGHVGDRLSALARRAGADLMVVGSHGRSPGERVLLGAVSHEVLHTATTSVACVPTARDAQPELNRIANVLVATDFSATGNSAVALAYGLVGEHGTVHLVHVERESALDSSGHYVSGSEPGDIFDRSSEHRSARERLTALIPGAARARAIETSVHTLTSNDVALAIAQAGERLGVDAICIGTHGRKGLAKALLGSVAEAVVRHTMRPVMLSRAASK